MSPFKKIWAILSHFIDSYLLAAAVSTNIALSGVQD